MHMRMLIWIPLLAVLIAAVPSGSVASPFQIVATTPSMGAIARIVGGNEVRVHVLVGPDRDAHSLYARPSMLAELRRAEMVVAVGAQLEEGWLPAALDGAANPRLRVGQPGHFVAAAALRLRPTRFDPSLGGHVHVEGNPHFNLSPPRMGEAAAAFAERLALFLPDAAASFHGRAEAFATALAQRLPLLAARFDSPLRVIAYHEEFDYLAEWLPVEVVDFIEPKPGVPPTSRHLSRLVQRHQGTTGRIVHAVYQPRTAPKRLGESLGWPVHALSLEPAVADAEGYFALIEHWVTALAP